MGWVDLSGKIGLLEPAVDPWPAPGWPRPAVRPVLDLLGREVEGLLEWEWPERTEDLT